MKNEYNILHKFIILKLKINTERKAQILFEGIKYYYI